MNLKRGPQRIVCLTEETTEWLYLLGEQHRIVGISGYTVRPAGVRQAHPRVSAFLDGKIDQIVALKPDLVIGFSDMQAELANKLIRAGLQVLITNQRSVEEIFDTLRLVAGMVGASDKGDAWEANIRKAHAAMRLASQSWQARPKVYFEEWDEPMISAIQWVSELIDIAGGVDVFPELGRQSLGKNRVITDPLEPARRAPDIIVGSWCGKKFRAEKVSARAGWQTIPAVQNSGLFEIKSCDMLQPGPAALTDGLAQLHQLFLNWHIQQNQKRPLVCSTANF
ncbi:MAG: cobalamin-binding protein [Cytophagales bacterium]|nr:cobalamin-binding protein [Cytophagales bacterium]